MIVLYDDTMIEIVKDENLKIRGMTPRQIWNAKSIEVLERKKGSQYYVRIKNNVFNEMRSDESISLASILNGECRGREYEKIITLSKFQLIRLDPEAAKKFLTEKEYNKAFLSLI